jgi:hypothetical protein
MNLVDTMMKIVDFLKDPNAEIAIKVLVALVDLVVAVAVVNI